MSTGYTVSPDDLRAYADKLGGQPEVVAEIDGLVSQADVGDKSWGVVGWAVYERYTSMISDLHDVLGDLRSGFAALESKFNAAASGYEEAEQAVQQMLRGVELEIENTTVRV